MLWKILQEMGIRDHLTFLLRNVYGGQEATVRTGYRTRDWFQIGKGVHQSCILSSCLFNFYTEYTMWNTRLDEAQDGIKIAGEILITSDMQMTWPYGKKWGGTKEPLDESDKCNAGSKQHSKKKFMASGPITSWQIDGERMETVTDYFLGLQTHCRWWLLPWNLKTLALWKKRYDQLDSVFKNRDNYFFNKDLSSQSCGFASSHVWMWNLDYKESWVPKNWCCLPVVLEKTVESPLD